MKKYYSLVAFQAFALLKHQTQTELRTVCDEILPAGWLTSLFIPIEFLVGKLVRLRSSFVVGFIRIFSGVAGGCQWSGLCGGGMKCRRGGVREEKSMKTRYWNHGYNRATLRKQRDGNTLSSNNCWLWKNTFSFKCMKYKHTWIYSHFKLFLLYWFIKFLKFERNKKIIKITKKKKLKYFLHRTKFMLSPLTSSQFERVVLWYGNSSFIDSIINSKFKGFQADYWLLNLKYYILQVRIILMFWLNGIHF